MTTNSEIRKECQAEIEKLQNEIEHFKNEGYKYRCQGDLGCNNEVVYSLCARCVNKEWSELVRIRDVRIKELEEAINNFETEITDLYHQLGKIEVWSSGNDLVCDMCEDLVKMKFEQLRKMVK